MARNKLSVCSLEYFYPNFFCNFITVLIEWSLCRAIPYGENGRRNTVSWRNSLSKVDCCYTKSLGNLLLLFLHLP